MDMDMASPPPATSHKHAADSLHKLVVGVGLPGDRQRSHFIPVACRGGFVALQPY